jgi:predicted metalloenzyme YecM
MARELQSAGHLTVQTRDRIDRLRDEANKLEKQMQAECTHEHGHHYSSRCNDEYDATAWYITYSHCMLCGKRWQSEPYR